MENHLVIRTEASNSLNFLIYVQNLYHNQKNSEDEFRFPYSQSIHMPFKEEFEFHFQKLWEEVLQRISDHPMNDIKIYNGDKEWFYQSLFIENDDSLKVYREIYLSFKTWWESFAGRFSVERSVDEKHQKLYDDLAKSLIDSGITPEKELNISLIYDVCFFENEKQFPYFAVVPIEDFYIEYKELLVKLQDLIY